jgi:hypothetical protein
MKMTMSDKYGDCIRRFKSREVNNEKMMPRSVVGVLHACSSHNGQRIQNKQDQSMSQSA